MGESGRLGALAETVPDQEDQRPDQGQAHGGGDQFGRHGVEVGIPGLLLPVAEKVAFLFFHRRDALPDGIHLLLALARGDKRLGFLSTPATQVDALLQPGQLFSDQLFQFFDARLLLDVVLSFILQRPYRLVQPGEGLVVRLKEVLLASDEEASLPRLGIHHCPQHLLSQAQHLLGVGHPSGLFVKVPGVPVSEFGVHDQEGHDQPDADQYALVQSPSHSCILSAKREAQVMGTNIVVDGAAERAEDTPILSRELINYSTLPEELRGARADELHTGDTLLVFLFMRREPNTNSRTWSCCPPPVIRRVRPRGTQIGTWWEAPSDVCRRRLS